MYCKKKYHNKTLILWWVCTCVEYLDNIFASLTDRPAFYFSLSHISDNQVDLEIHRAVFRSKKIRVFSFSHFSVRVKVDPDTSNYKVLDIKPFIVPQRSDPGKALCTVCPFALESFLQA